MKLFFFEHLGRFHREEKAQVLVEASLVLPVMLFFFFGLNFFHTISLGLTRTSMAARHGAWLYSKLDHIGTGDAASAAAEAETAIKTFFPVPTINPHPLSSIQLKNAAMTTPSPILDFFLNNPVFNNLPGIGGNAECLLVYSLRNSPLSKMMRSFFMNFSNKSADAVSGDSLFGNLSFFRSRRGLDPLGLFSSVSPYTARAYFPDRDEWHNSWSFIASIFQGMIAGMNNATSAMASGTSDMWNSLDAAGSDVEDQEEWDRKKQEILDEWRQRFPWAFD